MLCAVTVAGYHPLRGPVIALALTITWLPPLSVQFPRQDAEGAPRRHTTPPVHASSDFDARTPVSFWPPAKVADRLHAPDPGQPGAPAWAPATSRVSAAATLGAKALLGAAIGIVGRRVT